MAKFESSDGFIDWLDQRLAVKKLFKVLAIEYWVPKNINFLWAMGIVLMVTFLILFISGLILLAYYKPDVALAFDSVNKTIMQDVSFGWLWRHMHAVAASLIFLVIYIHMFTAIYYGSYKRGREIIWITGMLLFVTFSAEAFSGYMLPWGQMSYWAATVITDIFSNIPIIGEDLVIWMRGNFFVADSTLTRFFMMHVTLIPIVILGLITLHFYSLRIPHVNNQKGEEIDFDTESKKFLAGDVKDSKVIRFFPDFLSKDLFVVSIFLIVFFTLVGFAYDFALDPINFERANSLKTPAHIYPEWYFLWSYEILRGFFLDINFNLFSIVIASKTVGLIAFAVANGVFFLLPFLDRSPEVAPANKRGAFKYWFWILLVDMVVLTIWGKLPYEGINNYIGLIASVVFIFLFISLPIITKKVCSCYNYWMILLALSLMLSMFWPQIPLIGEYVGYVNSVFFALLVLAIFVMPFFKGAKA